MEPAAGTIVSDKLRLVRPLGQGGMGSVWLAEHLALDMEVAVKLIRPERAADASLLSRFEREAKSAARIKSPHVVQIKDYGLTDDSTPYIVMERLEGASLHEVLERERLGLQRVVGIIADVAEALASAHALGIVHRDIKPQNIFIADTPAGTTVKVLDFGVAKVLGDAEIAGDLTQTGTVIGSPPYMSPEQLEGRRDVDHRADMWSLAVVAYQALTGALPFEGGSFVRVGAAVLAGKYTCATALRPGLPPAIDDWFAKSLCPEVEGRFASAQEMAAALAKIAEAEDSPAPVSITHEIAGPAIDEPNGPDARDGGGPTIPSAPAAAPDTEIVSSIAVLPAPSSRAPSSRAPRIAIAAGIAAVAAGGALWAAWSAWSARPQDELEDESPLVAIGPDACPAEMVFVAKSRFDMGSEPDDEVLRNETPRHAEQVEAFCIDTTEVTVGDYATCAACGRAPTTVEGAEITLGGQQFWSHFCNASRQGRADHPINCVSWHNAAAYCAAQDKRLPTEAEWELAARGVDSRPFPWGHEAPSGARINGCGAGCGELLTRLRSELGKGAWPSMYVEDDGAPDTAPVGSFPRGASPAGVMDMAGNVWEWTASPYCPYDRRDCGETRRVIRGGGWSSPDPKDVRVTRRLAGSPRERSHGIGFRCAWPP